jgi:hypothetical protein
MAASGYGGQVMTSPFFTVMRPVVKLQLPVMPVLPSEERCDPRSELSAFVMLTVPLNVRALV